MAANDVWAVGLFRNANNVLQTLAEHWDGTAWSIIATPNVGAGDNVLEAVVAISSIDAWAVGYSRATSTSSRQTLTEHWNGSSWSVVSSPNTASAANTLYAVDAGASNDVWAVGRSNTSTSTQYSWTTLVMHWDGTAWSLVSAPPSVAANTSELVEVKAVSSTNVWAVGDQRNFTGTSPFPPTTLIEHWNGVSWTQVNGAPDNPNGSFLNGVAGTATDLWAVGGQNATSTTYTPLTEHWNGTTWTAVAAPSADLSAVLSDVKYISAGNVYAVGGSAYVLTPAEHDHTLIEQWNGTAWAQVTSPNATTDNFLYAAASVTAADVWAVGLAVNASGVPQTLTENLCTAPSVTSIATATGPAVGGTIVVITGTGFTGAVKVAFGTTLATTFQVDSDTQITATSPAHPGGVVDITVTVQGTSATVVGDRFTYTAPTPAVTGINPTSGLTKGGNSVTITGTGLLFATSVMFGAMAATSITSNTDTQIVAVSPAMSASTAHVTVTTAGGTSATSPADQFTWIAPVPVVTGISPSWGRPSGGMQVTITGTGFSFGTPSFGTTAAGYIPGTDTQLVAVSPAGTLGTTVHVTVTTSGGTSATSAADQFTYANPPACPSGLRGNPFVVDFNGDAKADVGFVTSSNTCVRLSTGTGFGTNELWQSLPFYGSVATLAGDVTGTQKGALGSPPGPAAVVAVNNTSTWVMTSTTGTGFNAPALWSSTPFYGTRGTFLADVAGTGKMALVAVNDSSVWVMLSNGSSFGAPQIWSTTPFYGNVTTLVGNVTGSGKAALIAVNNSSTWVMTSTGSGFNAPAQWSNTPFYGNIATLAASASGSGKTDLIAVNNNNTFVMTSTGSGFNTPVAWSQGPFYGTVATLAGSATGSGKADLVAINGDGIWVMTSTGAAYSPPTLWG